MKQVCLSCHSHRVEPFFEINRLPVDTGTLKRTKSEAEDAVSGSIHLCFCHECGLIFNQSFNADLIDFGKNYEVSLNCSDRFNSFQQATAERLVDRYDLVGKTIFEIGCGNGEFLETICRMGRCDGIGIDPTVKSTRLELGNNTIRFEKKFFDEDYTGELGDFICCLSVFEDVKEPKAFLDLLKRRLSPRACPVYLEVFNGMGALENGEVWSVHYEQCNYFSADSLNEAVRRSGFRVLNQGKCYENDQYLFIEFEPCEQGGTDRLETSTQAERMASLEHDYKVVGDFQQKFASRKKFWETKLEELPPGKVVLWGSGGKTITLLNTVLNSDRVETIVDNNQARQGRFIPGTGHQVQAPESLLSIEPEVIVVSNQIYLDEIGQQLAGLGVKNSAGKLPALEVA